MCDRGRGGDDLCNYFAPLAGGVGQTAQRQLNGLAPLGEALSEALGKPIDAFWQMRNGYALCNRAGLEAISAYLASLRPDELDVLRGKLCIGVHTDVEVTRRAGERRQGIACVVLGVADRLLRCVRSSLARVRFAGAGGGL